MHITPQALIYFDLQNKTNPGSRPATLQGSVCVPHQLLLLRADSLLLTSDIISWLKYLLCFWAQCVCHSLSHARVSAARPIICCSTLHGLQVAAFLLCGRSLLCPWC